MARDRGVVTRPGRACPETKPAADQAAARAQQARRAHGEVGAVGGHTGIGLLKAQRDTAPLEAGLAAGGDRLDEPHRLENGGQRVVAIGAGGADGQEQVDLPGRLDPHGRGGAGPGR